MDFGSARSYGGRGDYKVTPATGVEEHDDSEDEVLATSEERRASINSLTRMMDPELEERDARGFVPNFKKEKNTPSPSIDKIQGISSWFDVVPSVGGISQIPVFEDESGRSFRAELEDQDKDGEAKIGLSTWQQITGQGAEEETGGRTSHRRKLPKQKRAAKTAPWKKIGSVNLLRSALKGTHYKGGLDLNDPFFWQRQKQHTLQDEEGKWETFSQGLTPNFADNEDGPEEGESRRDFLKKMTTFLEKSTRQK